MSEVPAESEIQKLKNIIQRYFGPEHAEICQLLLGCACTLAITGTKKTCALWLNGPGGCGKSSILSIVGGAMDISEGRIDAIHVDNFTPKSLVSSLDEGLDLLEILPGKCLITSELNVLFKRPPSQVAEFLATMVKIMDSEGFTYASAKKITSYRDPNGRYHFVWFGALITVPQKMLTKMFSTGLSSRLYYINMVPPEETTETTVKRLTQIFTTDRDFIQKINICVKATSAFLKAINFKVNSIAWGDDQPACVDIISKNAVILKFLRAGLEVTSTGKNKKSYEIDFESPERATAILVQIARGLAVLESKITIQKKHLQLVTRVAMNTVAASYPMRHLIFYKLIKENGKALRFEDFVGISKNYSNDLIKEEIKNLCAIGFLEILNGKIKFVKEHEKTALALRQYIYGDVCEKICT